MNYPIPISPFPIEEKGELLTRAYSGQWPPNVVHATALVPALNQRPAVVPLLCPPTVPRTPGACRYPGGGGVWRWGGGRVWEPEEDSERPPGSPVRQHAPSSGGVGGRASHNLQHWDHRGRLTILCFYLREEVLMNVVTFLVGGCKMQIFSGGSEMI